MLVCKQVSPICKYQGVLVAKIFANSTYFGESDGILDVPWISKVTCLHKVCAKTCFLPPRVRFLQQFCGYFLGVRMKDTVWKLFEKTGNTAYYLLYKELTKDGSNHKSHRPKNN